MVLHLTLSINGFVQNEDEQLYGLHNHSSPKSTLQTIRDIVFCNGNVTCTQ